MGAALASRCPGRPAGPGATSGGELVANVLGGRHVVVHFGPPLAANPHGARIGLSHCEALSISAAGLGCRGAAGSWAFYVAFCVRRWPPGSVVGWVGTARRITWPWAVGAAALPLVVAGGMTTGDKLDQLPWSVFRACVFGLRAILWGGLRDCLGCRRFCW